MRLDLHVHTVASSDCLLDPGELLGVCESRGLDGLAICDHNTISGALEAQRFCADSPIRIIVGEEINTTQGEVIGLFLKEKIPRGLSIFDTVAAIREQGSLVYIPHPFDRFRAHVLQPAAMNSIADDIDIVEVFNARSWTAHGDRKARDFAVAHSLLMGAGSDAHSCQEVGNGLVVMEPFEAPQGFMCALREARIQGRRTSSFLRLWVRFLMLSHRVRRPVM